MLPSKLGYFREWKKRCGRVTSPVPGAFFFFFFEFSPPFLRATFSSDDGERKKKRLFLLVFESVIRTSK